MSLLGQDGVERQLPEPGPEVKYRKFNWNCIRRVQNEILIIRNTSIVIFEDKVREENTSIGAKLVCWRLCHGFVDSETASCKIFVRSHWSTFKFNLISIGSIQWRNCRLDASVKYCKNNIFMINIHVHATHRTLFSKPRWHQSLWLWNRTIYSKLWKVRDGEKLL